MKLRIVKKVTDNNELFLTLAGEMTVYSVVKLKELLLRELKASSGTTMNLAEVHEADTSGFQLLLFLKNESLRLGKEFYISALSSRLELIFSLYRETI